MPRPPHIEDIGPAMQDIGSIPDPTRSSASRTSTRPMRDDPHVGRAGRHRVSSRGPSSAPGGGGSAARSRLMWAMRVTSPHGGGPEASGPRDGATKARGSPLVGVSAPFSFW